MKKVSIREFQLNSKKVLDDLPVVLTRYNLPVAKVVALGKGPINLSTSGRQVWDERAGGFRVPDSQAAD